MAQDDLVVIDGIGTAVRTKINTGLQALGSCNSGATAPSVTYANMLWADTTANLLKIRNKANSAWNTTGVSIS